jgi:hypothetical protein
VLGLGLEELPGRPHHHAPHLETAINKARAGKKNIRALQFLVSGVRRREGRNQIGR